MSLLDKLIKTASTRILKFNAVTDGPTKNTEIKKLPSVNIELRLTDAAIKIAFQKELTAKGDTISVLNLAESGNKGNVGNSTSDTEDKKDQFTQLRERNTQHQKLHKLPELFEDQGYSR